MIFTINWLTSWNHFAMCGNSRLSHSTYMKSIINWARSLPSDSSRVMNTQETPNSTINVIKKFPFCKFTWILLFHLMLSHSKPTQNTKKYVMLWKNVSFVHSIHIFKWFSCPHHHCCVAFLCVCFINHSNFVLKKYLWIFTKKKKTEWNFM